MKKCPYCAETIQDEAIVCRYCGRDLVDDVENRVRTSGKSTLAIQPAITSELPKLPSNYKPPEIYINAIYQIRVAEFKKGAWKELFGGFKGYMPHKYNGKISPTEFAHLEQEILESGWQECDQTPEGLRAKLTELTSGGKSSIFSTKSMPKLMAIHDACNWLIGQLDINYSWTSISYNFKSAVEGLFQYALTTGPTSMNLPPIQRLENINKDWFHHDQIPQEYREFALNEAKKLIADQGDHPVQYLSPLNQRGFIEDADSVVQKVVSIIEQRFKNTDPKKNRWAGLVSYAELDRVISDIVKDDSRYQNTGGHAFISTRVTDVLKKKNYALFTDEFLREQKLR